MRMKSSPKLRPNGWDGLAAAVVLVLADLTEPEERTYTANGCTLRVTFGPGSAQVTASDCPTQDCVHTGAITRGGQSIVCLPARIVIQLEGGPAADSGVDLVIG